MSTVVCARAVAPSALSCHALAAMGVGATLLTSISVLSCACDGTWGIVKDVRGSESNCDHDSL